MSYKTYDNFSDLTAEEIGRAGNISYAPSVAGVADARFESWAGFGVETIGLQYHLFAFTVQAGASYEVIGSRYFAPFVLLVYDNLGNVIAVDDNLRGEQLEHATFVAPTSGTFYAYAWNQGIDGPSLHSSLGVWQDLDSPGVAPGGVAPTPTPPPTVPPVTLPPSTLPPFQVDPDAVFEGTAGNDNFTATNGNDAINGGAGFDTVLYSGVRANYLIIKSGDVTSVTDKAGAEGVDSMRGIEKIQFADQSLTIEYNDLAQALYLSYFGRAADTGGLLNFQAQLAALEAPRSVNALSAAYGNNAGIRGLIDSFGLSDESKALYSGDTQSFVQAIYKNVLNRTPDQGGLDFWSGAINSGSLTRANASLSIMAGAQSNTTPQGLQDAALVANKINIASNFTFTLDTPGKALVYAGNDAAAQVRAMLASVNSETDAAAFQETVNATLAKLSGTAQGSVYQANAIHSQADDAIQLIGLQSDHILS